MASRTEIEFLKVLACMAWADEEMALAEINFIGRLMHEFRLSGDERLQVEMYLDEKVGAEEARLVMRRFLARARRSAQRRQLLVKVEELLDSDEARKPEEQEWLRELRDSIAESRGSFFIDNLRSLLRLHPDTGDGRESDLHDFIHNRVLFKLRRRVGAQMLERQTRPGKLKAATLCAAFLARVGYVDEKFLREEQRLIEKLLADDWGLPPSLAEAVCAVAMEAATNGMDLYRLLQEAKSTLPVKQRKQLVAALFALARAEGKMSGEELEEIRKIAHGLQLTHREFINAKLKTLGRDSAA